MFGILAILWLFQIVLLQPLYESNKINVVKDVANNIAKVIDKENLDVYVESISKQNDLCVSVITDTNNVTSNNLSGCSIDRIPLDKLYEYYSLAQENGGSYLAKTDLIEMTFNFNNPDSFTPRNKGDKNIVYTKVVMSTTGTPNIILVNSRVTRINAATQTLSDQLFVIAGIIFIGTIGLAFFLSKKIVKPIADITKSSKSLAKGSYDNTINEKAYQEVHALNDTLIDASVQIQKADQAKRDLIANVSHDLRTPLTMISGYGEMMLDLPDEKTDDNLKVIIEESKRLTLIVNDLLDLSRLSENKINLQKEQINLTQCIKDVIKTYETYLRQNKFEIEYIYDKEIEITADSTRLMQVLHNFINNAINYSNDSRKVIVRQSVVDNNVRIEIQDFGMGIDENQLSLIWDRYYKVDKEHTRVEQGSGIGLAIVKEILELHKFKYGVNSKLNEGSTFYFEAPIRRGDE
jgi:signal transduction histidine kinase